MTENKFKQLDQPFPPLRKGGGNSSEGGGLGQFWLWQRAEWMLPKVEDGTAPGSEGIHDVADGANHGRTPYWNGRSRKCSYG